MMRVLQVYKDFFPPTPGGVERCISSLCLALRGWADVRVLISSRGPFGGRDVRDGVEVFTVPEFGRALSTPFNPTLPHWLRRLASDVYHLHCPNPMAEVAWLLARPRGPLVVSYHSDVIRQARTFALYRPLYLRFLARAKAILVAAPQIVSGSPILSRFKERCRVIPWAIDTDRLALDSVREEAVAALRARIGGRFVLFVGRLIYFKGLEYLLEAMRRVDGRLVIVGDGPLRRALRDQTSAAGLNGRVTFVGAVSEADLPTYLHACDLLVLPSSHRSEGFGLVQLEAHACGKPTVCTEVGTGTSYANLDGITGLVVPARDPGALAEAINHLLRDESLRQRLGEAARERAHRDFSLERLRDAVLDVYAEVVRPREGVGRC